MYRVCKDPLLPVQARLWPADVLLEGVFFVPQISQKEFGNHANTNIKMVWPKRNLKKMNQLKKNANRKPLPTNLNSRKQETSRVHDSF
jgi:hypothetical protein